MKQIDELIRGEMAAVKSIDAILAKLKDQNEIKELTTIKADHLKAVDILKPYLEDSFKDQEFKSGPWSAFASAFTGGASLFGDKAALNALKVGEQHSLNEYQEFLKDNKIKPEVRQIISSELLPQQ
jgi:hypothetical protein